MAIDLKNKKILIVDDLPQMRMYLRTMVNSLGAANIDVAVNGDEAVKRISRGDFDIILCDYYLGEGKNGQQVLEEIKVKNYIRFSTVFMIITAQSSMEFVAGAAEYTPDDYLIKPFTVEMLKNRIEKLVEKKSFFAKIDEQIQVGDYKSAIQICDDQINQKNKYALEFMKLKANLAIQISDYPEAQKVYEKILALRQIPWARLGLAKTLILMKDFTKARIILEKLIEENHTYIEAYDWLAYIHQEVGNLDQAQNLLKAAADISPRGIKRQKLLGEISHQRGDLDIAEKAYRMTVKFGKNSCFREPSDYTGLSKVMLDKGDSKEALKALKEARTEFRNHPEASLQSAIVESIIYKKTGQHDLASASYAEAEKLYEQLSANTRIPETAIIDMAKACFEFGKVDEGKALIVNLVKNNHDDEKILKKATAFFEKMNLGEESKSLVQEAAREIIQINNRGVKLAREGKIKDSITLFEESADSLQNNKVITLNAAQAMLQFMQREGKNDHYLSKVRMYLDRIKNIEPANAKYQKLLAIYKEFINIA